MTLTSPAFKTGEAIPARYTADGEDISPPLTWGKLPRGTKVLALVMEDPDAPTGSFVHWVAYDLPLELKKINEACETDGRLPKPGGLQGINDFGDLGYRGPSPPPGMAHRYIFTLYCLDAPTGLHPGVSRRQLLAAVQGHIVAQGELVGTYAR